MFILCDLNILKINALFNFNINFETLFYHQQISAAHLLSSITPDEENTIFSELWGADPGIQILNNNINVNTMINLFLIIYKVSIIYTFLFI